LTLVKLFPLLVLFASVGSGIQAQFPGVMPDSVGECDAKGWVHFSENRGNVALVNLGKGKAGDRAIEMPVLPQQDVITSVHLARMCIDNFRKR
jgi:hypothetical protein